MIGRGCAKRHQRIRVQRNRAGRRGGQLLTRAPSPPNKTGLPTLLLSRRPLSRRVAPYADHTHRTSSEETGGTGGATAFHTGYQPPRAAEHVTRAPATALQPDAAVRGKTIAGAVRTEDAKFDAQRLGLGLSSSF
jgi:hypothetical protein